MAFLSCPVYTFNSSIIFSILFYPTKVSIGVFLLYISSFVNNFKWFIYLFLNLFIWKGRQRDHLSVGSTQMLKTARAGAVGSQEPRTWPTSPARVTGARHLGHLPPPFQVNYLRPELLEGQLYVGLKPIRKANITSSVFTHCTATRLYQYPLLKIYIVSWHKYRKMTDFN